MLLLHSNGMAVFPADLLLLLPLPFTPDAAAPNRGNPSLITRFMDCELLEFVAKLFPGRPRKDLVLLEDEGEAELFPGELPNDLTFLNDKSELFPGKLLAGFVILEEKENMLLQV